MSVHQKLFNLFWLMVRLVTPALHVVRLLVVLQDLVIQYLCTYSHLTLLNFCDMLLVYIVTLSLRVEVLLFVIVLLRVSLFCIDTCYVENLNARLSTCSFRIWQ
jgi:hypothetical protein